MEGQSGFSRGYESSWSALPSHSFAPAPGSSPSVSVPSPQSLHAVITCEGEAKAVWRLPPVEAIPVIPRMVRDRQTRSDTFSTGDGQSWSLHACQTSDQAYISLYLRKENTLISDTKDYKTNVHFRLYASSNHPEIDSRKKSFVFNTFEVMNGYERCFETRGKFKTPFYVEVNVTPAVNNEKSRQETQFVGIRNEGNTCYINSLLQMLYHLPSFRNAVFQTPSKPYRDDLVFCLQKVLYNLQESAESVSAKYLMECLEVDQDEGQQDVHEFSYMFMSKIESAFSASPSQSFLSSLFTGKTETSIECIHVAYTSHTVTEEFTDLQLSVSDATNITDSLQKLVHEQLMGENQFDAGEYGKQDANRMVKFQVLPPVLQIYLKRFQYLHGNTKKLNTKFEFPDDLDLSKYLITPGNAKYRLFAILVHRGVSQQGHYFSFIKTNLSEWFKFNDKSVDKVTSEQVFRSSMGGDMRDLKVTSQGVEEVYSGNDMSAYMLCYIHMQQAGVVLNPQVVLSQDLERKLKGEFEVREAYIPVVSREVGEFKLPFLTSDHLQGHTGPGLFPGVEHLSYLSLPLSTTTFDLERRLNRTNRRRKMRFWKLIKHKSMWKFSVLGDNERLYEVTKDTEGVVFIEMEGNETLKCENLISETLDVGGNECVWPEEVLRAMSPPLRCQKSTLVFLKLYAHQLGYGDLILKSTANLNQDLVETQTIINYASLLEFESIRKARISIEHCGEMGNFTCQTVTTTSISTVKSSSPFLSHGDALILEFDPSPLTPCAEEYYSKFLYYTYVTFIPCSDDTGECMSVRDIEKIMGSKAEFGEHLLTDVRVNEVYLYLCGRIYETLPVISLGEIRLFVKENSRKLTWYPMTGSDLDPRNVPVVPLLSPIYYSILQPSPVDILVFYFDSRQEPLSPSIQVTLTAYSTIRDLNEAIIEDVKAFWLQEQPDCSDLKLVIYEHDHETKAYMRKLPSETYIKDFEAAVLSVKVLNEMEQRQYKAGGKRVDVIVHCEKEYEYPKYFIVSVRHTQPATTCTEILTNLHTTFQPRPILQVLLCDNAPPFHSVGVLEASNKAFLELYAGTQVCVELRKTGN